MNPRFGSAAATLALLLTLAASCTLTRPLHGLTCEPGAGDGSCLFSDPCEADRDCATASCASATCHCPTEMVTIDSQYCVDATEVTNSAYRRFLDTRPDPSAQPAFCQWNTSFAFDDGSAAPDNSCAKREAGDDFPASCVNWCDAHAFCASLGKHLCGKPHGGSNPESAMADREQSEWFNACSGGPLARDFSTESNTVADCFLGSTGPKQVSLPGNSGCEGGYFGLFNMSGNVSEWEDSCTAQDGADDTCLTRGGSFDLGGTPESAYQCKAMASFSRNEAYFAIGFRCCSG